MYDPSSIDNRTKISAKFQTKTGELMNSLYQSFTNKNMLQTLTKKGYSTQPPKISRNSVSFDYSNKFTPKGSIEQFHNSEYEPYNFIIQDTTDYKQFMTTHFDKLFKNIRTTIYARYNICGCIKIYFQFTTRNILIYIKKQIKSSVQLAAVLVISLVTVQSTLPISLSL